MIWRFATTLFETGTKTRNEVTNAQASKRQVREHTADVPGAFPASPRRRKQRAGDTGVTNNQTGVVSRDLRRDRSENYWDGLSKEVGLPKELRNLPIPSPYAPSRRPIPKNRPLHSNRSARSGLNYARNTAFTSPVGNQISSVQPISKQIKRIREPVASRQDDDEDPLHEIEIDFEDVLEDLPEFRRSSKLDRKDQLLKLRRAPSPGLLEILQKGIHEYEDKKRKEEEKRRKPKPPRQLIMPLPDDALKSLPNMAKLPADKELNMFGRVPVTARDLLTLRPDTWLNDEIINSWLWELCDKSKSLLAKQMEANGTPIKDDTPRYHAFNTLWYPTMAKSDWRTKVPRWAKRAKVDGANLLKVHKILIPVHQGAHWTLLVILPQRRLVRYYNSLRGSPAPYLDAAQAWISHELGSAWSADEWTFDHSESGQQVNMSDCGVFTSCNALATFYSDFTPDILPTGEMVDAREFMKYILITGGFKDNYALPKLHPDFHLETDRSAGVLSKGKDKAK